MGPTFFLPLSTQDEREARETVKREQDEAYRLSLEADRKKVFFLKKLSTWTCALLVSSTMILYISVLLLKL